MVEETTVSVTAPDATFGDVLAVPLPECGSEDWLELIDPVTTKFGSQTEVLGSVPLATGCRSTVKVDGGEATVLVEALAQSALADVVRARTGMRDDDLMGFVEVAFADEGTEVSSSLLHRELDRLIEDRWVALSDTTAVRIEVALSADGEARRPAALDVVRLVQEEVLLIVGSSEQPAVSAQRDLLVSWTLGEVIGRIAESEQLGPLATEAGAEAIAFEYAFPENFAAIAPHRRDARCTVLAATAVCEIDVPGTTYRFDFVASDEHWMLDGFALVEA